jgi:hypothetical protein
MSHVSKKKTMSHVNNEVLLNLFFEILFYELINTTTYNQFELF